MPIRKPTLAEWFLSHQLRAIKKNQFHLPISIPIDVTRLRRHYTELGKSPPYTALIVKAIALMARKYPVVNRMGFAGLGGRRILEFDHISVILPIVMDFDGNRLLSAAAIRHADQLSVTEIRKEIQKAKDRKITELPVGKFILNRNNHLVNRLCLRFVHFLAYRLAFLQEQRGGGLAFSSLLHLKSPTLALMPFSYGPTALTFCAVSIHEQAGRSELLMGVSFDHFVLGGEDAMIAVKHLSEILSGLDAAAFRELCDEAFAL